MPSKNLPVYEQARLVAHMLDNDPVLAAQLKEYLSPARLVELLDIPFEQIDITSPERTDVYRV